MLGPESGPLRSIHLPGYAFEAELYRGRKRVVYRARRDADAVAVIVKAFADEFPTPADTASLRREYDILRALSVPGVVRPLALESHHDRVALILEDAGDLTLKQLIARGQLDIGLFLLLAHQLATALAALHRAGIVHKDVNANNVVIDTATSRATLTDFGIASRASSEPQRPGSPHLIEGTLAYMSPEQTGRMNRDLDYRSDLYSLGVTYYEMLTGRLPFESRDPLEVIHEHVAETPVSPEQHDARIPRSLSNLVMRLLAKSAEDRYQSAEGVAADLEHCRAAWEQSGTIPDLRLGQDDIRDRFVVPQRLYGREMEVARLLEAFDRVAAGQTELVLVSGYSGIGKTSLIQETHRSLAQRNGYFIAGKFDQLARDVPYGALTQAFQSLVRHLLAESDEQIAVWRLRLQEALGANGQVIVDVIPDLARLIGPQPAVAALGAAESQNRFNLVFQQFLGVFARPEHPLVLFLDDLQWADAATLTLFPLFLSNSDLKGLLVIGAYRDNEVSTSHPLTQVVQGLAASGAMLTALTLRPLSALHLRALLNDTLSADTAVTEPLSEVLLAKTGGNPFFVTQFLKSLHQDGQITFDRGARAWRIDLPAIRALQMTENVVDLMAGRIQRLAEPTQRVLRLAACVGNRFDLATLSTVSEEEPPRCAADLWPAVEQGLVLSDEQSYGVAPDLADGRAADERRFRFLHDRVQQAAYALIPEESKRRAHLTVGRLLLARGTVDLFRDSPSRRRQERAAPQGERKSDSESNGSQTVRAEALERSSQVSTVSHGEETRRAEWLFDVVNQLNYGAALIEAPPERLRLAELNLAAGRKAKASAAFPSSLFYFAAGTALLPDDVWVEHYDLAYALHIERAEAEYLCGRYTEAEAGFVALLARCRSPLERADVYVATISLFETMARYQDAIRAGSAGLSALGINLPQDLATQEAAFADDLEAIRRSLDGRRVSDLLDLPQLAEQRIRQAMRLLMAVWAPAYISSSGKLWGLVAARMVRLSVEHGNTAESAFGYVHHAITVGSGLGDYERGHAFGELALALNDRLADFRLRAIVHHIFAALVAPYSRPFATCFVHAHEGVRAGLESGNLQVAAYAHFVQSWYGMQVEESLAGFHEKYTSSADFLARLKNPTFLEAQRLILHWGLALQGHTERPTNFTAPGFDETTFVQTVGQSGIFRGIYGTLKLELLHTFGLREEARVAAREGEPAVEQFVGSIWPAMFLFRHILTLCDWLSDATASERPEVEAKLDQLLARLNHWAENSPQNFRHQSLLAAAEVARVHGHVPEAIAGYEAALEAAAEQSSPRHRALVNELYGKFWLDRRQPKIAAAFLAEARYGYQHWGADAKVADLERRYGHLLVTQAPTAVPGQRILQTTQVLTSAIDVGAVMKAAQALASEIDLERLLSRLMRAAMEHAGADRGRFVLEHDGAPAVHVTGSPLGVTVRLDGGTPLGEDGELPVSLVNYVRRTGENVVLDDAAVDGPFCSDLYFVRERPRSAVCTPVTNQSRLLGILYLENRLASGAFTAERTQILHILSAQAAIAIENARLFAEIAQLKDRLQAENVYLQEEIRTTHNFEEVVGNSPILLEVLHKVEKVAETDSSVLILGETGTGKELFARAIHSRSARRDRPLVKVNCGAIAAGLVESELFGHVKGAFTGAIQRRIGRFELAAGGTIFLDEVGELPLDTQAKLLRVLQEHEFEPVGSSHTVRVDVRVIAATNRDFDEGVRTGRFRADLLYRLNVFPLRIPALRERPEDIPLLISFFVTTLAKKLGKPLEGFSRSAMEQLMRYPWPGNVRELQNIVERAAILAQTPVLEVESHLLGQSDRAAPPQVLGALPDPDTESPPSLEHMERAYIISILRATRGVVEGSRGAAGILDLHPNTLRSRIKKLAIQRSDYEIS